VEAHYAFCKVETGFLSIIYMHFRVQGVYFVRSSHNWSTQGTTFLLVDAVQSALQTDSVCVRVCVCLCS